MEHQTNLTAGFHTLPFEDYLALPGWGSGSLRAMRRGPPARVQWERAHRKTDTDATLLGRLVHAALLEPDLYASAFVCKPDGMSFATKEGKAWRAEQTATIVEHGAYMTAQAIVAAVRSKEPANKALLRASHKEVSIAWDCPVSREPCKGRPDWIAGNYVYDLKVSRHADREGLSLRAYYEGWMHQLAHYRTGTISAGVDVHGGRLVVVAPAPPHVVYTLEVKPDALDLLELENIATLKAMRECRLADDWPGTPDSWTKIEPPANAIPAYGEVSFGLDDEEGTTEDV